MDISHYFEPINTEYFFFQQYEATKRFGNIIQRFDEQEVFPDLAKAKIALVGVGEERNAVNNEGCGNGMDSIRNYFYNLFAGNYNAEVVDLGNIRIGHDTKDTYYALSTVTAYLLENNIVPIIIGGSQDLTLANYQAYENLGQIINIVAIDNQFDLGENDHDLNSKSYLSRIILHQPNYLFNYTNLGFQTYFVNPNAVKLMKNLFFDTYRLGNVRAKMEEVEPMVRNADMISIDISAVRQSDAPGNANASPNGFSGEELCQITRYAGLSEKLSSIGFYEYNPEFDKNGQTAHLIAQMIWYFIDGYYSRLNDFPVDKNSKEYKKFMVKLSDREDGLVFFKSKKSDRWWMEVDCASTIKAKYERHYLVPCSQSDYEYALEDDIPDRWWQAYQKLM
ncbi:MAG: formimidoylglutamase [Bacteroidales bacterium]|jgi:formiminoglutamase|nr:formimidoylglutamase [Bacteroidales bacterium]